MKEIDNNTKRMMSHVPGLEKQILLKYYTRQSNTQSQCISIKIPMTFLYKTTQDSK
jgi:hypothetical protein